MVKVFVGAGSNIDREQHIDAAIIELQRRFANLTISSIYESEAFGFAGKPFFNLVIGFETDQTLAELISELKKIELQYGKRAGDPKFAAKTLDLDLLLYGDFTGRYRDLMLPRDDILNHAYVLEPLAELIPEDLHPVEQKSYAALWSAFRGVKNLNKFEKNGDRLLIVEGF